MPDELRELAEWVHENIMGECVHEFETLVDTKGFFSLSTFAEILVCSKCKLSTYIGDKTVAIPTYPTDIALAWKVVDKLRSRCPQIQIEIFYWRYIVIISRVGFTLSLSEERDNLPEAICRLAKKAHKEGWLG